MHEIPVYKAEREAGLEQLIRSQASFSYASLIEEAEDLKSVVDDATIASLLKTNASEQISHINLYPFKSVLATAGVWNKNDDVFDIAEVWASRHTPKDQPINDGHDCSRIIGHITDDFPVNDKMERLAENLTIDELPEKYHIVTGGVLYKHYDKKELADQIAELLKAIAKGEKYVSMECLFRGFDYAVIDPEGKQHIVTRSEESAFLTKHLRVYKGKGEYQGHKLGRLMRNITFSGKGIVDKPANPASVILAHASVSPFSGETKNLQIFKNVVYLTSSDDNSRSLSSVKESNLNMANELELKVSQLQADLAKANEDKASAIASLKNLEAAKVTDLENQLKAQADKTENVSKKVAELENSNAELAKKLTEATSALSTKSKELEEVKAQQALANRINILQNVLGESEEQATSLAKTLSALTDEQFKTYADYEKAKVEAFKKAAANKPAVTPDGDHKEGDGHPKAPGLETKSAKEPDKKSVKTVVVNDTPRKSANSKGTSTVGPMAAASEQTGDEEAEVAAAKALENVVVEQERAALSTAGEHIDEGVQKTRKAIADVVGGYIQKNHARRRGTR